MLNIYLIHLQNPATHRQSIYHIEIGQDYPKTIVNHKNSRDYVMDKFKQF